MKKLLILCTPVLLLFTFVSCGGSEGETGVLFEIDGVQHTWQKGETGVFDEDAIAVQNEEEGVYRLNMIAAKEVLKSGTNSSDNVVSLGIRKDSPSWKGKNKGLMILWLEGERHIGRDVDVEVTKFGKVGELITGKFSGKIDKVDKDGKIIDPMKRIDIKGGFQLRRIEDKSLEKDGRVRPLSCAVDVCGYLCFSVLCFKLCPAIYFWF